MTMIWLSKTASNSMTATPSSIPMFVMISIDAGLYCARSNNSGTCSHTTHD